jgi:hypothetical protein
MAQNAHHGPFGIKDLNHTERPVVLPAGQNCFRRGAWLGIPGADDGGDAPGFDVVRVAGDAHPGREQGRGEQALDVSGDGGARVGDGGGFQSRLVYAGGLGGLTPEGGVGEEAGPALRVVNDRDLDARAVRELPAG